MLRKTLIATCLLIASGSVLANDNYAPRHGTSITPRVSITFGGGPNYGYRDTHYQNAYAPRPVHVQSVYNSNNYYRGNGNEGRHHGQDNYRSEWRGDDRHDDNGDRNGRHNRRHD